MPVISGQTWGCDMDVNTRLQKVGGSLLYVPNSRTPTRQQFLPDCLIVFVHGFMSGPGAWKDEPGKILDTLGINCTFLQYGYPAKVWQTADVRHAAADLETLLKTTLQHYAHIVFISHSTGAIVVKELLRQNCIGTASVDQSSLLVQRTRCIINIAGAHNGGRTFALPLMWVYKQTWADFAKLISYVPVIGPRYGYFELGNQLQPLERNPFLQDLNDEYEKILVRQQTAYLPRPVRFDYEARNDGVVINNDKDHAMPAGKFKIGYALHFLKSILQVAGSTIPEKLFPQLLPGTQPPTGPSSALKIDLAFTSLLFIKRFDDRNGIGNLLSDEVQPTDSASKTQEELFTELSTLLKRGGSSISVITGPGGTGKSVLMRRLAKFLAAEWLSNPASDDKSLPLVVNMKRLNLRSESIANYVADNDAATLWQAVQDAWIPVAHKLREELMAVGEASVTKSDPGARLGNEHRPMVTRQWIDNCWKSGRTVLFLDSVDEFLNSYRLLGGLDFSRLIKHLLSSEFGDMPKHIVVAIREGEADAMRQLNPNWFKLDRLSPTGTLNFLNRKSEAALRGESSYELDRARRKLKRIFDDLPPAAQQTIATPLVLSKLPNLLTIADPTSLKTASSVLELALVKTIEDDPADNNGQKPSQELAWQSATSEQRLDMLSVLGWIFACDEEGPYQARPLAWLKSKLAEQKAIWQSQRDLPDIEPIKRLSEAFSRLSSDGGIEACLRRSVFQSIGGYVFDHRQWADLCIARFISTCILSGVFKPLTERTYHPSIFLRIADYLSAPPFPGFPTSIRRTTVEKMLDWLEHDPRDGQFVIGNFAAIMSHGRFGIDGDALAAILSNLDRIPDLAKHVILSGFGYRALAGSAQDPTAMFLRTDIIPATASHIAKLNPATASLVWCLLHALGLNVEALRVSWPRPRAEDADAIFDMVCPGFPKHDDLAQRISLQHGYVQTSLSMLRDEHRTIASVHYLFFAVVTTHRSAAVAETMAQLNEIFDDEHFEELLTSYGRCPQALELFRLARNIYRNRDWN